MRSMIIAAKMAVVSLVITILNWCYLAIPTLAIVNTQSIPITIEVGLGNTANELKFEPNNLLFNSRQTYKLLLSNPSPQKHYFTALEFANKSWTQKVDVGNVEIKGAIQELELRPNTKAEWILAPMKPGTYRLHCTIPGHTEAGMMGTITVK